MLLDVAENTYACIPDETCILRATEINHKSFSIVFGDNTFTVKNLVPEVTATCKADKKLMHFKKYKKLYDNNDPFSRSLRAFT